MASEVPPPPPPHSADYSLIETLHNRLRDSSITTLFEQCRRRDRSIRHRPDSTGNLDGDGGSPRAPVVATESSSSNSSMDSCCLLPNVRWTLVRLAPTTTTNAASASSSSSITATPGGHSTTTTTKSPTSSTSTRRVPNGIPTKNYLDLRIQQNKAFADTQYSLCLRTLSTCTALFSNDNIPKDVSTTVDEQIMKTKKSTLKELRSHLDKGLAACPDHGGLLQVEKEYQNMMIVMIHGLKKMTAVMENTATTVVAPNVHVAGGSSNGYVGRASINNGVVRATDTTNTTTTLGGRWIRGAMQDAIAERSFLQPQAGSSAGVDVSVGGGDIGNGGITTTLGCGLDGTRKDPLLIPTPFGDGRKVRRKEDEEYTEERRRYDDYDDGRHHQDSRSNDRYYPHDDYHHNGGRNRRRDYYSDRSHSLSPAIDDGYHEYCRRREEEFEAEYGKSTNYYRDDRKLSRSYYREDSDNDEYEGRHARRSTRDRSSRSRDRRRRRQRHRSHRDRRTSHGEEEGADGIENSVKDGEDVAREVAEKEFDIEVRHRSSQSLKSPSNDNSDRHHHHHHHREQDKRRKSGEGRRHHKRRDRSRSHDDDDGGDDRKALNAESEIQTDEKSQNNDKCRHSRHRHHRHSSSRRRRDGHRSSSRRNRGADHRHEKRRDRSISRNDQASNDDAGHTHNRDDEGTTGATKVASNPSEIADENPLIEDTGTDHSGEKRRNKDDGRSSRHHRSSRHKRHHRSGSRRSSEGERKRRTHRDRSRSRSIHHHDDNIHDSGKDTMGGERRRRSDRSVSIHGDDNNRDVGKEIIDTTTTDVKDPPATVAEDGVEGRPEDGGKHRNDGDDRDRAGRDVHHRHSHHHRERSRYDEAQQDLSSSSENEESNCRHHRKKHKRRESERRHSKHHRKDDQRRHKHRHSNEDGDGKKFREIYVQRVEQEEEQRT